jgi:hypothetical protein
MKNLFPFFISVIVLCISCKKDKKDQTTPKEVEPPKEIINSLISGTDCIRFERLFKGYKGEDFMSVKQTPDGGYIFCGSTETIAESESDVLVVKTDCFGRTEWMKTISNTYSDQGYDIIPVSTGYLLVASFSLDPRYYKSISYQSQLIWLDETGNVIGKQNSHMGTSTHYNKVIETPDGGFMICGTDNSNGSFILKTSSGGGETWIKYFDSDTRVYDVSVNTSKNYIACGSVKINQQEDIYLVELNAAGDIVWQKSIDKGNIINEAGSVRTLSNNEIVISGYNRTSGATLPGFAMRLDANGKEIWYKSLEAEGIQSLGNIVITTDNNIITFGTHPGPFTIVKLDVNTGSILWTSLKSANSLIRDLQLSADGGLIIAGMVWPSSGNSYGYILKTDKDGN